MAKPIFINQFGASQFISGAVVCTLKQSKILITFKSDRQQFTQQEEGEEEDQADVYSGSK